jgi:hypothetical protein
LRRAIRSITFGAFRAFGGSATIPLAKNLAYLYPQKQ